MSRATRFGPCPTKRRPAFTLLELLVVIAIIGVLFALLLPAVQRVREIASRIRCQNNLKQFGLALHMFHDANGYLPAGMVTKGEIQDSYHTGFTYLLPYIEQDTIHRLYHYDKQWYDTANYAAVGQQAALFYCPSNRSGGAIDLSPYVQQWGSPMPPFVGASDYVLCKGANAGLGPDPNLIPLAARGLFNIAQASNPFVPGNQVAPAGPPTPRFGVRFTDITDGLSSTFAIGEGAGGTSYYLVADLNNPSQPATEPFINGPAIMDQAWGAASLGDPGHPWFAGLFGVTAQYGMAPDPVDEPMNRRPGMPTIISSDPSGYNVSGRDLVSGFRSRHPDGCNFLFADSSVHFIRQSIDPAVYRALSTYAGEELVPVPDF
jgi:prepilin-type N-terminal cleavage/methylation domain-containing protein/prepilin-type processing-associated H-X9-DG protein